jgi:thiaminase/transcriptional activator TenA
VRKLLAIVQERIPKRFGLDPIRDIQVLCPMNRGGLGARSLNIELQKALTAGFKAIMREAAQTRSYAAALSVLVVAEWLYLDWASRAPQPLPDNFVHAEWITLHDNPDFRGFVDLLRADLDRVGPAEADLCRDFFRRAVALELSFFEAAYAERT